MGRFFKQTIRDIQVCHRTVLVRADYNVPLDSQGGIADDLRVRASLPTLRYLLERNCRVVVLSHLGRPKGKQSALSLAPVAARLAELLGRPVQFVDDCVGPKVRQAVRCMASGQVLLLENLRFYAEEELNDQTFAQAIARAVRPDYFVQDGFGVVHRAHASTQALTAYLPSVAGLLLEKEVTTITQTLRTPKRPFVAVVGGAKVSDKIGVLERLIATADTVLIGGAMANTFLAYRGHQMGASSIEAGQEKVLEAIYRAAAQKVGAAAVDDFLLLPTDVAVAQAVDATERRELRVDDLVSDDMAFDIGTETIDRYTAKLTQAQTVVWNGPVGYSTNPVFAIGSARLALAIAQRPSITSVICGGNTAEFILRWDGHDGASFTHVSTGGGASLELIAGLPLPGVESLLDAYGLGVVH